MRPTGPPERGQYGESSAAETPVRLTQPLLQDLHESLHATEDRNWRDIQERGYTSPLREDIIEVVPGWQGGSLRLLGMTFPQKDIGSQLRREGPCAHANPHISILRYYGTGPRRWSS